VGAVVVSLVVCKAARLISEPGEELSGGDSTVFDAIINAFSLPARNMAKEKRGAFFVGNSFFKQNWVIASASTAARDGLGPVFNTNQVIRPYTDLLLHDMGPELADGRPDFEASGSEWRTPPLWGLGLIETVNKHTYLLHDGRARGIEEAILWHGGEGEKSREGV
jgi:CxxC motif-containing protein (DUF1111 family)